MIYLKDYLFFITEHYSEIDKNNPFEVLDNFTFVDEKKPSILRGFEEYAVEMYKKGTKQLLCWAIYSVEEEKVTVGTISSKIKGEGYGQILMIYLAKKYGYQNLIRKNLTESGKKMRQRLDHLFDFDYEKSKATNSKHISKDVVDRIAENNPDIGMFLMMLVDFGFDEESVGRVESDYNQRNFDIQFSDIFELSKWIVDSKTNQNNINTYPPESVIKLINLLA
jgi:hypothetical protein